MKLPYDDYYKTENLFGAPYPELIHFFTQLAPNGKLLDLGCGQGRDAIPLARLGFDVTGIDNAIVGIDQMNAIATKENLKLTGKVADIYKFDDFAGYKYVVLDSMFHFGKKDLKKETDFIKTIVSGIQKGCLLVVCIQNTGKKVEILNDTIGKLERVAEINFNYTFEDGSHKSVTPYTMLIVKK